MFGNGADAWRDNEIEASMEAATHYNANGVYDKHLVANVSPGTPTADADWDGQIRFGDSRNYRVALHEISHTLGAGTTWQWATSWSTAGGAARTRTSNSPTGTARAR